MSSTNKLLAALLTLGVALPAAAEPQPVSCPKPVWPVEAIRYELKGTTTLYAWLDENGRATKTKVFRSSRWELLDQAAMTALAACTFRSEDGKSTAGAWVPVQYVWSLDGGERAFPVLVEGSCPASGRFSRFAPFDKGVTGPDGVLVRLLMRADGQPFGIKAEARGASPDLVRSAIEYVQACRFTRDPEAKLPHTDTVTGRVLLK